MFPKFDLPSNRDYKCLTLDVIASTVFSMDTDVFNETDSIFLKKLDYLISHISPASRSIWEKMGAVLSG